MKRKLTAILSADVRGYSRLMADDEAATVATLTAHRRVFTEIIDKHNGRVVDSPGDNLLAEFDSAVNAVQGAIEIQNRLGATNADLPEHRRMEWRIGINLGDVIFEDDRIYGDGVNVAARIEGLAEAGGVCVSRSVHDQVKGKLAFGFEYLGEHAVKNIADPVRVYRVVMQSELASSEPAESSPAAPKKGRKIMAALLAGVALAVLILAVVLIWKPFQGSSPTRPTAGTAPRLKLPDKPSIVVLPFVNLTGDPRQEYFSDGMTEAIIRGLSRLPKLFVIARNSAFTYKGKAVKVQRVGRELGVRYVLEGSVQRSADRVRITAQLIDAKTGRHLWSQKFDRPLKDVFALQDEITMKIMIALQVKLTDGEQARLRAGRASTRNIEAYELYLQGDAYMRRGNKAANVMARKLFQRAIKLDPKFSAAYGWIGFTHMYDAMWGWTEDRRASLMLAAKYARQALALNPSQDLALVTLGWVYFSARHYDKAKATIKRAVALNPNNADAYLALALVLVCRSQDRRALTAINRALRLNPFPTPLYYQVLGIARRGLGQYDRAIVAFKKALALNPRYQLAYVGLVLSYVHLGRLAEARAALAEILKMNPDFSLADVKRFPYKAARKKAMIEAFKKAGLKK